MRGRRYAFAKVSRRKKQNKRIGLIFWGVGGWGEGGGGEDGDKINMTHFLPVFVRFNDYPEFDLSYSAGGDKTKYF